MTSRLNANVPQFVTTVTVYVRLGSSLTFGGARCWGPFGAGAGTVRQDAGAAPPDGAALVVEPATVVLVAVELLLLLLPQPATTSPMATARLALRTEL